MTGPERLPGGSDAAGRAPPPTAALVGRAREAGVEQPLADLPRLEVVEVDREGVVDLVGVGRDAEPQPLAEERAHRVADEVDEVLELDHWGRLGRERAGQERQRLGALVLHRAGAVERDAVEAPGPLAAQHARA